MAETVRNAISEAHAQTRPTEMEQTMLLGSEEKMDVLLVDLDVAVLYEPSTEAFEKMADVAADGLGDVETVDETGVDEIPEDVLDVEVGGLDFAEAAFADVAVLDAVGLVPSMAARTSGTFTTAQTQEPASLADAAENVRTAISASLAQPFPIASEHAMPLG